MSCALVFLIHPNTVPVGVVHFYNPGILDPIPVFDSRIFQNDYNNESRYKFNKFCVKMYCQFKENHDAYHTDVNGMYSMKTKLYIFQLHINDLIKTKQSK